MHRERGGPRRVGPMAVAWLAVSLTLGIGTRAGLAGQAPATDLTATVDAWMAGDDGPMREAQRLPAAEVRTQVTRALQAWGAGNEEAPLYPTAPAAGMEPDRSFDARRQAVRRTQALAAMAMQVLLDAQVSQAEATVWEEAARAAAARLARVTHVHLQAPEDRRRLTRFTGWWFVAYLQFLHEARRTDFDAAVGRAALEQADEDVRAEFYAIRGLRAEYMSRLAPASRKVPTDMIGGEPATTRPQEERGRWMRRQLGTAEGLFAEAIRRHPAHDEARLHWGRVALERGHPDAAVERLAPLVRVPCADVTCGLAALFTGEAHDRAGRLAEADRSYAQASSVVGVRPQALVALMQLAVQRGESTGAALTRHLESDAAASAGTAWGAYLNGKRLDPAATIARLRAGVLPPANIGG